MNPRGPFSIYEIGMHYAPERGGADRYFVDLCRSLQRTGVPVIPAAFGTPTAEIANGISLGNDTDALPSRLHQVWKFASGIPSGQQSMLATHFSLYALPALLRAPRVPHVVHFHGPWSGESAASHGTSASVRIKHLLERYVYRSADALIVLSEAFAKLLVSDYGIARDQIHVIPGGVDMERFHPGGGRDEARRTLGWNADRKVVLCVRRLVARMGVEKLIGAFGELAQEFPDWDLHIGGTGPLADQFRAQVSRSGLQDRIRLLGFIREDQLALAYRASNFSIVPSQSLEGFGLVVVESLACGTPVIVTPVGGLPEVVSSLDAENMIAQDSTAEGLAAIMHHAMRGSLPSAEACRRHAETHYQWPHIASRVLDVYQKAVDRKSKPIMK